MEFYSQDVAKQIPYCIRDPYHKQLLVVEAILESNDSYANDTIAQMTYLSENIIE